MGMASQLLVVMVTLITHFPRSNFVFVMYLI